LSVTEAVDRHQLALSILCVTKFVTLSVTVLEAAMWVNKCKIVIQKFLNENLNKRKGREVKIFFTNFNFKDGLGVNFTGNLTQEGSLHLITHISASRVICVSN